MREQQAGAWDFAWPARLLRVVFLWRGRKLGVLGSFATQSGPHRDSAVPGYGLGLFPERCVWNPCWGLVVWGQVELRRVRVGRLARVGILSPALPPASLGNGEAAGAKALRSRCRGLEERVGCGSSGTALLWSQRDLVISYCVFDLWPEK